LTRVKAFFRWATAMEYAKRNPSLVLKAITPDQRQTWPLTAAQFEELLAATHKLDADARYQSAKVGQHLRAVFRVQRQIGLRVGDVLAVPKSALLGNCLSVVIEKKRKPLAARVECILPDHVVEVLASLPLRKEEHPDYFVWSKQCSQQVINMNKWLHKVDRLNDDLSFKDEAGSPMSFRSHIAYYAECGREGARLQSRCSWPGFRSKR
jgi:site-specific recombinase XerD